MARRRAVSVPKGTNYSSISRYSTDVHVKFDLGSALIFSNMRKGYSAHVESGGPKLLRVPVSSSLVKYLVNHFTLSKN